MFSARAAIAFTLAGLWCGMAPAHAQTTPAYPTKPLRFLVGFPPGGFSDLMARAIASKLSESFRHQVIVDNRPGASTTIAADLMSKSAPDGYTILMMTESHVINPSLYKQLPFDAERDFAPVTLAARAPFLLVVHPSVPAKTVKELIALARARPGELNNGSGGVGTLGHLGGELLNTLAKIKIEHIPYKGAAPAMQDVQSGLMQVHLGNLPVLLPIVKAGRLRALAVTTAKRAAIAPEYPTMAEAGVPGFDLTAWYGVMTRAGTPNDIVAKLNQEIVAILRTAETRERLATIGGEPVGNTPAEFAAFLKSETTRYTKLVRDSGARLD